MATYTKIFLSQSNNGQPVNVAASASPGTLIHVPGTGTSVMDEVWLWAADLDSTSRLLTVEFGGVANPDNRIEMVIPGEQGLTLVIPGVVVANSSPIRAFSVSGTVVNVVGYVNRITP